MRIQNYWFETYFSWEEIMKIKEKCKYCIHYKWITTCLDFDSWSKNGGLDHVLGCDLMKCIYPDLRKPKNI